jgi:hypothetical protein
LEPAAAVGGARRSPGSRRRLLLPVKQQGCWRRSMVGPGQQAPVWRATGTALSSAAALVGCS